MVKKHRFVVITILMLLLAGLGCSLSSSPPVIYVTATPEGGGATSTPIIITATPEVQPTLAPVPTATLQPDEGLHEAKLDLRNGNYEDAVVTFQALLNDRLLSDTIRAEAAYNLGQAAVRDGLFQAAVDSLTEFITKFPNDARIGQAYFLRGDAYL